MQNEKMKTVDIQFCCFQHCYGQLDSTYEIAALVSAKVTRHYYSSTINCSDHVKDNVNRDYGAQFDIQAEKVTSNRINATGSYSMYCGSLEYRDATTGHFQF